MADKEQKGPAHRVGKHHSDEMILASLMVGGTIQSVAKVAGVSENTVRRRLASKDFKRKLARAKRELVNTATRKVSRYLVDALDCLYGCLSDANSSVRVAAARTFIETSFQTREMDELIARVEALEGKRRGGGGKPELGLVV